MAARSVCCRGRRVRSPPVSSRKRSLEPLGDLLDRQRPHARRGQLDRERDAVQPPADLGDRRGVLRRSGRSAGCDGTRAVDEQAHRLVLPQASRGGGRRREPGTASDGTRPGGLAGDAQRLAAGRQHAARRGQPASSASASSAHASTGARSCRGSAAACDPDVLHDGLDHGPPRVLLDSHARAPNLRHERGSRIGARSTNQTPSGDLSITRVATCKARRVLPRPPAPTKVRSLAFPSKALTPASTDSRPMKELAGCGRLFASPPSRAAPEILAQLRMQQLVDLLRSRQVAQSHRTQVEKRCARRHAVANQLGQALRQQDLSAVGGAHDARGAIDLGSEYVAVAAFDNTAVQPDAHSWRHRESRSYRPTPIAASVWR